MVLSSERLFLLMYLKVAIYEFYRIIGCENICANIYLISSYNILSNLTQNIINILINTYLTKKEKLKLIKMRTARDLTNSLPNNF